MLRSTSKNLEIFRMSSQLSFQMFWQDHVEAEAQRLLEYLDRYNHP